MAAPDNAGLAHGPHLLGVVVGQKRHHHPPVVVSTDTLGQQQLERLAEQVVRRIAEHGRGCRVHPTDVLALVQHNHTETNLLEEVGECARC